MMYSLVLAPHQVFSSNSTWESLVQSQYVPVHRQFSQLGGLPWLST